MESTISCTDLSWQLFEKTGSVQAFLEYTESKDLKAGEVHEQHYGKGSDN